VKVEEIRIEPIGDHVVVKRDKPQERSSGGIMYPEMAQKYLDTAVVVAVGPGPLVVVGNQVVRGPMQTKVGDRITLPSSGYGFRVDPFDKETDYEVLHEHQIYSILRKETP
jgi:co-chaperonin GroES (HSP10)